ncbi:hypothetical protein X777_16113 [Ooceraea biroi]|uniref:Uncharacterized protein n=1 Tax=Ooceraea biroi TaxID=2015173 RepID=A0A026WV32_OOCBI|nr:hypothetical protein X777_16113 [Ooceraea biroi]
MGDARGGEAVQSVAMATYRHWTPFTPHFTYVLSPCTLPRRTADSPVIIVLLETRPGALERLSSPRVTFIVSDVPAKRKILLVSRD